MAPRHPVARAHEYTAFFSNVRCFDSSNNLQEICMQKEKCLHNISSSHPRTILTRTTQMNSIELRISLFD